MINALKKIIKPRYEPLNCLSISISRLKANYNFLKICQPGADIFPVLKSNAYGHGLKEICQVLKQTDAKMVAVDSFPEAQIAYRYFPGKVLILGEMPLDAYRYCNLKRTEFVVYNEKTLEFLIKNFTKPTVHLFINTGMNREGIKDFPGFLERQEKNLRKVKINGICSHLASAEKNSFSVRKQEQIFMSALDLLQEKQIFPKYVHLGNSAAIFTIKNKRLTAFRAGLSFYGYNPFPKESEFFKTAQALNPALKVRSKIVSIQELNEQETVSYNETYTAANKTKIGIIPFGYFEGLPRALSNKGLLRVIGKNGKRAFWTKIAGRVCMNLSCINLENNPAEINDEVEIISWDNGTKNSLESLSSQAGIIPYDFLVHLESHLRRELTV